MANNSRKFYQGNAFLISVIALTVIFLVIVIFLMWNPFKIRSYKGMKDIEARDIFTIAQEKEIDNYYVFFYKSQSNCVACAEAEPFVVEYAELARSNKDAKLKPIFVVDLSAPGNKRVIAGEGDKLNLKDVTIYTDLKVLYTPTLIEISKGKVTNAWESKMTVLKELNNQITKVTNTGLNLLPAEVIDFRRKDYAFN